MRDISFLKRFARLFPAFSPIIIEELARDRSSYRSGQLFSHQTALTCIRWISYALLDRMFTERFGGTGTCLVALSDDEAGWTDLKKNLGLEKLK